MPDFTLFIPLEIFRIILSHVGQVGCIECMTVCRRWYKLIPLYGTDVWKDLKFSIMLWPRFNKAMLKCLGTHVKKVSIFYRKDSSEILRRLQGQGCNIESLDITAYLEIGSFDLYSHTIFNGIGLYRTTLTKLFLRGYSKRYCSLYLSLNQLPALTHLSIKLKEDPNLLFSDDAQLFSVEMPRDVQASNDVGHDDHYNLVFLSLESEFRCGYHMEQTIKRCRRLKYLLASNSVITGHRESPAIDFSHVLKLCPSISYIHWGERTVSSNIEKEWLTLSKGKGTGTDSENESDYEEAVSCHLRRVEFCSNDLQQHISTLTACLQQPSLLEHLRLCGVSGVDLYQLWNEFARRNRNLLLQPPQLKTLELVEFCALYDSENDISFEDFFNYFLHVEQLKVFFCLGRFRGSTGEQYYIRKVVEAIGHQSHQLRYLCFDVHSSVFIADMMTLCDNLYMALCGGNPKLEILQLNNVPISNHMLLDLCHHPQLHTLKLVGYQLHKHLTVDGWISFARKLNEKEESSCSGGRIRSILLSCGYCNGVSDEVLEELACNKSLENLRIEGNGDITDAGVNKFASIKNSISEKDMKIEIYHCPNVSTDNPHVVFARSPAL